MFSGLDLSLLPLIFSLILTVASRLLHLYSSDDKTSRLRMKSFFTVRDTAFDCTDPIDQMEERSGSMMIELSSLWAKCISIHLHSL